MRDRPVTDVWTLHWLEAAEGIGPATSRIAAEIHAAAEAISRHVELPRIDVLITRIPGFAGIPEIGMVGHAYRPSCFSITVAPDNPHFAASLEAGHVRATVVHEVNHCLRMREVGFGRTLGEVLVSEGLAALFCRRVLGTQPMPWDVAVEPDALRRFFPSDEALASTGYDHAAWFFGRKPALYPRWLGYAMGHAVVDAWAKAAPRTATDLVTTPAAPILAAVAATFRNDYVGASPAR